MKQFSSIRTIEKKGTEELSQLYKSFYEPISQTICNEFFVEFKCKLIM